MQLELLKFKTRLKRRAEESSTRLREIFDEEAANNEASMEIGFADVESTMYKQRRRILPPLPPDAASAYEAILQSSERFWASDGVSMLQGRRTTPDGGVAVFFAHPEMLPHLRESDTWCLDGTFKTVPVIFYQLLTIGFIAYDIFWPSVYVLLNRKTAVLYKATFSHLRTHLCPGARPETIVTDFEMALMTAAEDVFAGTAIVGCWFHYCQAVVAKFKAQGLQSRIRKHQNTKERRWLLQLLVLPLLPAEQISAAVQQLKPGVQGDDARRKIFAYMENFWLLRVGTHRFCVHNRKRRTNCDIESYHRGLLRMIKIVHPNLWLYLENLTLIVSTHYRDFVRASNGRKVRRIKPVPALHSSRVADATQKLHLHLITPLEFLTMCSHVAEKVLTDAFPEQEVEEEPAPDGAHPTPPDDSQLPPKEALPVIRPQPQPRKTLQQQLRHTPPRPLQPQPRKQPPQLPVEMQQSQPHDLVHMELASVNALLWE
jgi:hypothetical protein